MEWNEASRKDLERYRKLICDFSATELIDAALHEIDRLTECVQEHVKWRLRSNNSTLVDSLKETDRLRTENAELRLSGKGEQDGISGWINIYTSATGIGYTSGVTIFPSKQAATENIDFRRYVDSVLVFIPKPKTETEKLTERLESDAIFLRNHRYYDMADNVDKAIVALKAKGNQS